MRQQSRIATLARKRSGDAPSANRTTKNMRRRMSLGIRTASIGRGRTLSARPARKTSLFGKPAFGGLTETKKARSVVALSRDPPLRAEFAGSPPAAGFFTVVNRPLVRIPADRHTTTGTCDLGKAVDTPFSIRHKPFLTFVGNFFGPCAAWARRRPKSAASSRGLRNRSVVVTAASAAPCNDTSRKHAPLR